MVIKAVGGGMPIRPDLEDRIDAWIHALALVLSVLGLLFLLENAPRGPDILSVASPGVYGTALVLLFSASLLNLLSRGHRLGPVFRALDHCAIFLLIAGTYSPVTLLALPQADGWNLFATVWTLALAGIVLRIFWARGFARVSLGLYLGTGWIGGLWAGDLASAADTGAAVWLLAGGLAYTTGVYFFAAPRIPFANAIWHLFVAAGSACHFFAIAVYVLPVA